MLRSSIWWVYSPCFLLKGIAVRSWKPTWGLLQQSFGREVFYWDILRLAIRWELCAQMARLWMEIPNGIDEICDKPPKKGEATIARKTCVFGRSVSQLSDKSAINTMKFQLFLVKSPCSNMFHHFPRVFLRWITMFQYVNMFLWIFSTERSALKQRGVAGHLARALSVLHRTTVGPLIATKICEMGYNYNIYIYTIYIYIAGYHL